MFGFIASKVNVTEIEKKVTRNINAQESSDLSVLLGLSS